VLDNKTDAPFITADQPIINLDGTFSDEPPEKQEFYYPLSPTKAMLLVEETSEWHMTQVTSLSVNRFNALMLRSAYEQVFSNSEEYLNSIKMLRATQR
jgi:hypothetical protein